MAADGATARRVAGLPPRSTFPSVAGHGGRDRHLIENAFCRVKDFRRITTRYDKLAASFLLAVALVTAIAC